MTSPPRDAGFTLVELMISLVLFGLIAVAGLALVNSILGIEQGTRGRLERLADLRRAAFLVDADLSQLAEGTVAGGGDRIAFRRRNYGRGGTSVPVSYALTDGVLTRFVAPAGGQDLLDGVASARWRFLDPAAGWLDRWPAAPEHEDDWPAAVELVLVLKPGQRGPSGSLRKLVALPAHP